ncbi:MAG: DMT family transporter [Deltaproteobacteria bacterium]|nr:DMT family transporter [Deltaproteobacteria bacterium]
MIAIGLSLAACLGWGIADFLGGLKSRQLPTITVLVLSNMIGITVIGLIVGLRGEALPGNPALLWAVAGGIAGIAAMLMLYQGLAVGSMSIIAPISATGVILPVILGIATGDTLSVTQKLGIASAMFGSVLAGMENGRNNQGKQLAEGVEFAVAAAVAIGLYFIVMAQASKADPYWATFIMRLSFAIFLVPMVIKVRPALRIKRFHMPAIMVMGTVDALASVAFALATTMGMLSLVSVVGALYPAITIFLSVLILRERIQKTQIAGVLLAITGVVLISAA